MGVYANAKQYLLANDGNSEGYVELPSVDGLVVGASGFVRSDTVNRAVTIAWIDPVALTVGLRNADSRSALSDMSDLTTADSAKLFQTAGVANRDPSDLDQAGRSVEAAADPSMRLVTLATTLTQDDEEGTVLCNGTFAITLPTAGGRAGATFTITNVGVGVITLNTTAGQTISGDPSGTITLAQWDSVNVRSTGSNYILV